MIFPEQIMIVEDEAITQRYLKDILVDKDVEQIDCFDNATDALSAMEKRAYQLILMDINIKGSMDGIQLSRKILDKYSLPIVFISAYADDATLEDVLELSPYGFITKPFGSKEVVTSLSVAYKRFLMFEAKSSNDNSNNMIQLGKRYRYNRETSTLFDEGETVILNAKQHILMAILVKNINNTVSFKELEIQIWPEEDIAPSSLRTLVYTLRKLLPELPLQTHSKLGYSLNTQ